MEETPKTATKMRSHSFHEIPLRVFNKRPALKPPLYLIFVRAYTNKMNNGAYTVMNEIFMPKSIITIDKIATAPNPAPKERGINPNKEKGILSFISDFIRPNPQTVT